MTPSANTLQSRLHQAAREGDTAALRKLIAEEPLLLQRIEAQPPTDTPLHIASLLGHVDFVETLLKHHPQLARISDDRGSFPLHLASASGHLQVVKLMCKDLTLCKLRDKEQRTPLHSAAASGKIDVLKELLSHVDKETARAGTDRGETTLHLSVKFNQMDAATFLVGKDKDLVNMKDDHDNTVLHLATARKQIQMLKVFLEVDGVDVEAQNEHGFTALDVLVHSPSERGDLEIGEMLRNAGCKRATKASKKGREESKLKGLICGAYKRREKNPKELKNMHNTLLIVATLIATVTFTAGLSPPGGVWSDPPATGDSVAEGPMPSADYTPGRAIQAKPQTTDFSLFLIFNTIGLVASCSIILLLVSGLPLKNRCATLFLTITLWVSIVSVVIAFIKGAQLISSSDPTVKILDWALKIWVLLMFLILIVHLFRGLFRILTCLCALIRILLRKYKSRNGENNSSFGNPTDVEACQGCCIR